MAETANIVILGNNGESAGWYSWLFSSFTYVEYKSLVFDSLISVSSGSTNGLNISEEHLLSHNSRSERRTNKRVVSDQLNEHEFSDIDDNLSGTEEVTTSCNGTLVEIINDSVVDSCTNATDIGIELLTTSHNGTLVGSNDDIVVDSCTNVTDIEEFTTSQKRTSNQINYDSVADSDSSDSVLEFDKEVTLDQTDDSVEHSFHFSLDDTISNNDGGLDQQDIMSSTSDTGI